MGAGGLDVVPEAEVAGGARELGLPVGLGADEDSRLLVYANAQRVLTDDPVPLGVDLRGDAILGFVADRHAVDADVHVRAVDRVDAGGEEGGDHCRVGAVSDVQLGETRDLAGTGGGGVGHGSS